MAISNDARSESSHLGKSFHFKGEISGAEDIYIDGEVEGTIQLPSQAVTVGPNGRVHAQILARELTVHGKLNGNGNAQDRIEVTRTGSVCGDLSMTRISIQDGAFIQGRVDIRVPDARPAAASAASSHDLAVGAAAGASATIPVVYTPAGGASPAPGQGQGSLLDRNF